MRSGKQNYSVTDSRPGYDHAIEPNPGLGANELVDELLQVINLDQSAAGRSAGAAFNRCILPGLESYQNR